MRRAPGVAGPCGDGGDRNLCCIVSHLPRGLALVRVTGTSMQPTLRAGCVVLVRSPGADRAPDGSPWCACPGHRRRAAPLSRSGGSPGPIRPGQRGGGSNATIPGRASIPGWWARWLLPMCWAWPCFSGNGPPQAAPAPLGGVGLPGADPTGPATRRNETGVRRCSVPASYPPPSAHCDLPCGVYMTRPRPRIEAGVDQGDRQEGRRQCRPRLPGARGDHQGAALRTGQAPPVGCCGPTTSSRRRFEGSPTCTA